MQFNLAIEIRHIGRVFLSRAKRLALHRGPVPSNEEGAALWRVILVIGRRVTRSPNHHDNILCSARRLPEQFTPCLRLLLSFPAASVFNTFSLLMVTIAWSPCSAPVLRAGIRQPSGKLQSLYVAQCHPSRRQHVISDELLAGFGQAATSTWVHRRKNAAKVLWLEPFLFVHQVQRYVNEDFFVFV